MAQLVGGEPTLSVPEMKARKDADALLGVLANSHARFTRGNRSTSRAMGLVVPALIARLIASPATRKMQQECSTGPPALRRTAEAEQAYLDFVAELERRPDPRSRARWYK